MASLKHPPPRPFNGHNVSKSKSYAELPFLSEASEKSESCDKSTITRSDIEKKWKIREEGNNERINCIKDYQWHTSLIQKTLCDMHKELKPNDAPLTPNLIDSWKEEYKENIKITQKQILEAHKFLGTLTDISIEFIEENIAKSGITYPQFFQPNEAEARVNIIKWKQEEQTDTVQQKIERTEQLLTDHKTFVLQISMLTHYSRLKDLVKHRDEIERKAPEGLINSSTQGIILEELQEELQQIEKEKTYTPAHIALQNTPHPSILAWLKETQEMAHQFLSNGTFRDEISAESYEEWKASIKERWKQWDDIIQARDEELFFLEKYFEVEDNPKCNEIDRIIEDLQQKQNALYSKEDKTPQEEEDYLAAQNEKESLRKQWIILREENFSDKTLLPSGKSLDETMEYYEEKYPNIYQTDELDIIREHFEALHKGSDSVHNNVKYLAIERSNTQLFWNLTEGKNSIGMDKETIGALLLDAMMHAHPSIKEGCNPRPSLEVYKNNEQEYMAKHADQGIQDNKEDQPSKKAVRWVDQVDQVGGAEPKTLEEKVYFKSTMRGGSPALGQDPNKACYKEGVDSILIYNKKDCTGLHPNAKTAVFEITKKHLLKPIPPAGQGNHHATQIRREKAETSISMDLF